MQAVIKTAEYKRRADAISAYYARFLTGNPDADFAAEDQRDKDLRGLDEEFTVEI
jgi:hypothetical protein